MSENASFTVADNMVCTGKLIDYILTKNHDKEIQKITLRKEGVIVQEIFLDEAGGCIDVDEVVIDSDLPLLTTETQWVINNHKTICANKISPIVEGLIRALAPHVSMTHDQLRQAAIDNLPDS